MSRQRIASNLLVVGSGQAATWALSTGYLVLVSRYLGPAGQGTLTLAFSIVSLVGLFVALGMDTLITRTVARDPARAGALAGAAILVRLVLALPALGVIALYTYLAHLPAETRLVVYAMAAGMVVTSMRNVLQAVFQGHEAMSYGAISGTLENVCDLAFAAAIIHWRGSIVAFPAAGLLVALALLAINARWMRHVARAMSSGGAPGGGAPGGDALRVVTLRVSRADLREVVVGSLAFWASSVFLTVYVYIDTLILAALAGDRAVGLYSPATRMFSVALFLPSIIGIVTLPRLSRLGLDDVAGFRRAARQTLALLIAGAVPVTIGLATFAGPLMLTVYGARYAPSVPVLVILSLCIPWTYLNIQFSQTLAARDRQWRWTAVMIASCALNPIVNLLLIPLAAQRWHNATVGAALALLATEVFMSLYGVIALHDIVLDWRLARASMAALVAGAAQGAVLWATSTLWATSAPWAALSQALALAAYLVAAMALGALPREDVDFLAATITRRLRRDRGGTRPASVPAEQTPPI